MSLKTVNLNLVPVLRELLRTRSVSEAGRELGRSPSAISEGLSQLRAIFADRLLVRVQGGMTLTPRAMTLIDQVEALYSQATTLFEPALVNPVEAPRLITIAAHDYHVLTIGPRLVSVLQTSAPLMTLRFVDLGQEIGRQLTLRDVDFALMPKFYVELLARARLEQMLINRDSMVALMREGHPLAARTAVTREELSDQEHIAFQPAWESPDERRAIGAFNRQLSVRVRVSQLSAIPQFVAHTNLVAMVPLDLARLLGPQTGIIYRPLAFEIPPVEVSLCWSPVQNADPGHRWFREQAMPEIVKEFGHQAGTESPK